MLFCFRAATVFTVSFLAAFSTDEDARNISKSRLCQSGCESMEGGDLEKVVSFEECVQSCVQENSSGNRFHVHGVRKRSQSRRQRRVGKDQGEAHTECEIHKDQTSEEAVTVEGLNVDFTTKKPHVYVSWKPMDSASTDFNWTSYAFIHSSGDNHFCWVIPKNQTYVNVSEEYWKYPEAFYVQVVLYPHQARQIPLNTFYPPGYTRIPPAFTPDLPTKDTTKVVGSIVGGLAAGIVLLVVMFVAFFWKKRKLCPASQYPETLPQVEPQPDKSKDIYYSCYYPENDAFREKVASVVNYFRQNGYDVIMDVMVSKEISSQGPTRWAERQIRKARKVLIFLSPGLVNLAFDEQEGGHSQDINRVWIELEVLQDLYTRSRSAAKMVCIGLPDFPVSSQDLPLWAKISYKWPEDAQEILKRLNDRPSVLPV